MTYFAGAGTLQDEIGNTAEVGSFGEQKVANPTTQISATFERPLDTGRYFSTALTGAGVVESQYNRSLLRLQTGGTGSAELVTTTVLRYKTGTTIESNFTAGFGGAPSGADVMRIGLYDGEDGVFLGYEGPNFVVGYRNINKDGGTEPDVTQVVDVSSYTMSNIHRFRVRFGYLGVGNISFEIHDGIKWTLLHKFVTDGNFSDRTHIGTVILPMMAEVSSATNPLTLLSGSWNAQTYDKVGNTQDIPFFTSGNRNVSATALGAPIVAFRSKTTFGGYNNKVRSQLISMEFGTGSEGLYAIEIFKYPAGTLVSGTWNDVNANSVIETNITSTETPGVGDVPIFSTYIAISSSGTGVASKPVDFTALGVRANPGEEFLITKKELIGGAGDDLTSWSVAYLDLV